MSSNSKSVSKKFVIFTALIFSVIVFLLIWWLLPKYQSGQLVNKGVQPNEISIRQVDGQIQWQYLDGEWNSIVSVDELRGEDGKDGADGADGVDGQNGTPGAQGAAGQNGLQGVAGSAGEKGEKGDTGATGATGEKGETGTPGTDGLNGVGGKDGVDGQDGVNGQDGKDGQDGADGKDGIDGQDGREIEIQKGDLYIQWRYTGDSSWNNIIAYSDLKGEKGDKGETGVTGEKGDTGAAGQNATISVTNSTQPCSTGLNVTGNGTSNLGLQFTGSNVPAGGMTGQVLTKNSNNNCDFIWKDTHELRGAGMPEGVMTADVGTYYTDTLATNGAVRWVKATGTGNTGWKVVYGDTGWRDVPGLLSGTLTGSAKVRRINQTIYIYARINSWGGSWNGGGASLPAGMRPMVQHNDVAPGKFGSTKFTYVIQAGGNINVEAPRAEENTGNIVPTINFSSPVGDTTPWPATLPGTPTN